MAKAEITLKDGTSIAIDGSAEEVAKIVSLYQNPEQRRHNKSDSFGTSRSTGHSANEERPAEKIDLAAMANLIRDFEDAEVLEEKVLNQQDVVNRVLMCLYINKVRFPEQPPMTTGEVSKLLKQLGVPVSTANVSTAISRKAKSLVMADGVRKKGAIVRYELNRRGLQYFEKLMEGK